METHWYATLAYEDDYVWALNWRDGTDYPDDSMPITLRMWAPPPENGEETD